MESNYHSLPPLKRYRLMQQDDLDRSNSSRLPAKKRKEARNLNPPQLISTVYLPAKKRIWALRPDLVETRQFDLNVEYKPPLESPKKPNPQTQNDKINDDDGEYKPPLESPKKTNPQTQNDEINDNGDDDDDGVVCAVCDSTDGDPTDPIVFCDGCDLMVHSSCYGHPLVESIPEGDWFCARCQSDKDSIFICSLCPNSGGAMKPTKEGKWAHIVCALLVPEVFFDDSEGREGIDCSRVPKRRYEQCCYVCEGSKGCAIDCSEPNCELSFHVSCGFGEDLCIEYRDGGRKKKGGVIAAFCKEHTQLWDKQQQTGKFKIVARDENKK